MASRTRLPSNHGFNLATIVQVGLIPTLTAGFIGIGWYFTTNNTLKDHDLAIKQLRQSQDKTSKDDETNRDELRKQFMSYQQKSTEILGKLDTRMAVSETKQEIANQTLLRIADEIQKISQKK